MSDEELLVIECELEPDAEEIERERSLAGIYGSYAVYLKSLPPRAWVRTGNGWVSAPR